MKPADKPRLELKELTKRYGNVTVLDACTLSFDAGSIHALLGANGAGKSTLVRMIAGLVSPTSGSLSLDGRVYSPLNKRAAEQAGVEIVQQELNLITTLTVAENLQLARLPSRCGVIRQGELRARAIRALNRVGLTELSPDARLGNLGVGTQQMVEIAAALDRECRLLILDEPTAALTQTESETLFQWLEKLREQGVTVIYISHRLDEVKRLADQISILRDGRLVGTYQTSAVSTDQMVERMSGEAVAHSNLSHDSRAIDEPVFRVCGLSGGPVRDVSFEVQKGECLGIAGLVGAGRTELLRLIFGADIASGGHIEFEARAKNAKPAQLRFDHPAAAVAAGLAMVTEDRKANGLLLTHSIQMNSTIAAMWQRFSAWGIVRNGVEREEAEKQCKAMEVRCTDIRQTVGSLSGGNQQKVAIAKWLVRGAKVFLFDEPTRGIDVGARRRIYGLLRSLAAQGKAMIVVSSDTDELMEICDRIAVMSNGTLQETFSRDDWSAERIMQASFSGYLEKEVKQ